MYIPDKEADEYSHNRLIARRGISEEMPSTKLLICLALRLLRRRLSMTDLPKIQLVVYETAGDRVKRFLDEVYQFYGGLQQEFLGTRFQTLPILGIILGLFAPFLYKWAPLSLIGVGNFLFLAYIEELNFWRLIFAQRVKLLIARTKSVLFSSLTYEGIVIKERSERRESDDPNRKTGSRERTRNWYLFGQVSFILIGIATTVGTSTISWASLLSFLLSWSFLWDIVTIAVAVLVMRQTYKVLTPHKTGEVVLEEYLVYVENADSIYLGIVPGEDLNQTLKQLGTTLTSNDAFEYSFKIEQLSSLLPVELKAFYPL